MKHIYIGDEGKGLPLVLVHGFLGSSKMWEPQINFFKDYFRVITPDLPGFGKSSKIKSLDSINSMAKIVLELLKKRDINKFNLMGHSMGGMIVQEMAIISGDKINKLICYSTGSIGDIPGRFESIDLSREKLKKDGIEKTANRISKKWFVEGDKAKYFYLCNNANKTMSEEAADNALKALKNWRGLENLQNIKNKTLIIWGDKDKSYNLTQAKTLEKNILNSSLVIFEGCAHNIHLEKIEEFNRTVFNFINSN